MKTTALDAADIRILSALQQHGQLSKSELSELVGLSATPCWARFAKLKKEGLIRGYHADLAVNKIIDVSKVVVTVSLKSHRKADFDRFEKHIHDLHEVTNCVATGGGMDYVLTVVTTSLAAFQNLMDGMLSEELGIDRYMTYIVTREVKSAQPSLSRLIASSRS
jgi:Lrp/AsnC family transcriptional regulator of ectoine degradation